MSDMRHRPLQGCLRGGLKSRFQNKTRRRGPNRPDQLHGLELTFARNFNQLGSSVVRAQRIGSFKRQIASFGWLRVAAPHKEPRPNVAVLSDQRSAT